MDSDEDQLMLAAAAALLANGYDLDNVGAYSTSWCEGGQHYHIRAILKNGKAVTLILERPIDD